MFYDNQSRNQQEAYKKMLSIVGSLSNLFSDSAEPMLYYRAHENIFCKYFEAKNLAREDCSADAKKDSIGIGLKTWVGRNDQKVAEFGKLRPSYEGLTGIDLIKEISRFRNTRIRTTMNMHGLEEMIYHIVKRIPHAMEIYETSFDYIDIDNITVDENRGNKNNTYFSDGRHTYHFNKSKSTLYMIFENMDFMDSLEVNISEDPYQVLEELSCSVRATPLSTHNQLCLRLYSVSSGIKYVPEKSGLNQWNGCRTQYKINELGVRELARQIPRDPNEIYIPYPAEDRKRSEDFFPPKDTNFDLRLPDGVWIKAKVCQQDSKAIMSNPNNMLGKWLLRDVFELPEGTKVTYQMLCEFGIDCAVFTKEDELKYSVDFGTLGTYEQMNN